MLIKLFSSCSDFKRTLRRRRLFAFAMLALGIIAILCYLFLLNGTDLLPDFAQGFYLGVGSGLCLGAVILLVRCQYLLSHPEARKKAQIEAQDEREQAVVAGAFQVAGYSTFFLTVAGLLVMVAVNRAVALALLVVLAVYSLTFLFANLYLSKKL